MLAIWIARLIDHYLLAGVSEDNLDAICRHIQIPIDRVTRYVHMVNIEEFHRISLLQQWRKREKWGCTNRTRLIALPTSYSSTEDIEFVLRSFQQALVRCDERARRQTRLLLTGVPHKHIEELVEKLDVHAHCIFLGELVADDLKYLLLCSDIFLAIGSQEEGMSVDVVEAMAAGCVVIASPESRAHTLLLADGRGFVRDREDCTGVAEVLAYLIHERYQCVRIGRAARAYVSQYHTPEQFCRTLLRVTSWQPEYCAQEGLE
jgi:glycosyltransferase involved in cell wall biosynthesis